MRRSKEKKLDRREAVDYPIDQIERLGLLIDAIELKELASRGQLEKMLPIKARDTQKLPADFVEEKDLVEASPMPLSPKARRALIKASIPRHWLRRGK